MEHYPFATGDLLCRPHARLAQSEPKVKGKMNGKPPLTFSSAGAILQIWQQRNAPLPSSHILFCFTSCFGVYTKLGTHPIYFVFAMTQSMSAHKTSHSLICRRILLKLHCRENSLSLTLNELNLQCSFGLSGPAIYSGFLCRYVLWDVLTEKGC